MCININLRKPSDSFSVFFLFVFEQYQHKYINGYESGEREERIETITNRESIPYNITAARKTTKTRNRKKKLLQLLLLLL